jgi:hypothetical protein
MLVTPTRLPIVQLACGARVPRMLAHPILAHFGPVRSPRPLAHSSGLGERQVHLSGPNTTRGSTVLKWARTSGPALPHRPGPPLDSCATDQYTYLHVLGLLRRVCHAWISRRQRRGEPPFHGSDPVGTRKREEGPPARTLSSDADARCGRVRPCPCYPTTSRAETSLARIAGSRRAPDCAATRVPQRPTGCPWRPSRKQGEASR